MEKTNRKIGKQSIELTNAVYIKQSASIVGKKESEGPLGNLFDINGDNDLFGCDTWEEAESTLQKEAVTLALGKASMTESDISYILAGDLLGQCTASTFGSVGREIPFIGMYGACSTCGLGLGLAAILVSAGYAQNVISVTSSHFASAEKEFRYPLDYGSQRPPCSTWTVTGSGAYLLSREKHENRAQTPKDSGKNNPGDCAMESIASDLPRKCVIERKYEVAITAVTTGKIIDYGIKDSMNMGACMAPAACDTIYRHLKDFEREPEYYDKIITGDLGTVGQTVLLDLLKQKGFDISERHMDCGIEIFNSEEQGTNAGGSGCGCAASVLAAYLLPRLASGEWKRILFLPTGALLSKVSFNEGKSIPGIAHAVVIERL